ncbi:gelsolin repeat protein, putative [Cordyceps militaris CM01]|uniref:Gelsolin repeat protein, putative n=1 Tax=Cordyceps militaris (strain CM01) TaxID=983644 RepID=G3JBU1_CORMM|nr:gelsolin repeat protein, putative [Cordyceps militaris CM01]EGX94514.1 gelsolin repeat protein, putative [Cordyceps militaris CM01]
MSDEVSQFLEQVEQLRGKQIEDDQLRAREREEFMAAKRERQARREERARSISPQKSSPANTPSPRARPRAAANLPDTLKLDSSILLLDDTREPSTEPARGMGYSDSPTKENEAPIGTASKLDAAGAASGGTLTRSSTLSWQQRRPNSRGSGTTSRPLSVVAAQNATQRGVVRMHDPPPAASPEHQTLTREDIAKTLGLKDPSWFRQTADRGENSAAFRKNQVEDSDTMDMSSFKAQLPGMSGVQKESVANPTPASLASPLSLNPPAFEGGADRHGDAELPSGRSSPTRSGSPTKGLGGFVQSAMMKRSDSIKRWSVASPPGLSRVDSVSGNVGGNREGARGSPRPRSTIRESATPESSRPTSRSGIQESASSDHSSQGALSREPSDLKIPISPSKTMDSRRWSPTKSSWLDSALNRPESPRPQHKSNQSQPDWMSELARSKAASPSGEGSRPSSPQKHQVSIGGLMRTTPFDGGAKTNTTGLGGIYSPPPGGNRPQFGHAAKQSFSIASIERPPSSLETESPCTPTLREAKPEGQAGTKPDMNIAARSELTPESKPDAKLEPLKRPSVASPPAMKPKPATPPKMDFRSGLKPRPLDADAKGSEQPEFRNALGNLRRTKTQNYVAPDEFKGNILRGKSGLAVTGGPQKTERRDEFKDSILKKREDFKKAQADGKGVARTTTAASAPAALPEGLARRAELGKGGSIRGNNPVTGSAGTTAKRPEPFKPVPAPKRVPSGTASAAAKNPAPEKPRRISTEPWRKNSGTEPPLVPSKEKEATGPANLQQGQGGTGRLADRFNSSLANMLARGPPPMASNGGQRSEDDNAANSPAAEPSAPGPQLTHMTKARARGPKRKAPTGAGTKVGPVPSTVSSAPVGKHVESDANQYEAEASVTEPEKKVAMSVQEQVAAKAAASSKPSPQRHQEASPIKSKADASSSPKTPLQKLSLNPATDGTPAPLQDASTRMTSIAEKRQSRPLIANRLSTFLDNAEQKSDKPSLSPKHIASPKFTPSSKSIASPKTETPSKPLPSPRYDASPNFAASKPVSTTAPLSVSVSPEKPTTPREKQTERQFVSPAFAMPSRTFGTVGPNSPRPTLHGPRPQAESSRPKSRHGRPVSSAGLSSVAVSAPGSPMPSPTKQPGEINALFKDFFGPPRPRKEFKVDTGEILMSHPGSGIKIQTQEVQMYRLSGDGKKTPVSAQNERVLFDGEMYICAHSFKNATGAGTVELYFWVGDEVPDSMAQDAQIFAQREAKAIGGRLLKLYQGKETTEFMQALGGVIIIRRGSSDRFDSLAPHMLCGRRYLGQVAFDEVDMNTSSLCAGFPFIISHNGKCCLWKGKGSDVDELSAARLVGMENTISGELMELEEGSEPVSFWELFEEGQAQSHSADHWRLKPNYSKYGSRLFCSDADARRQITEIAPFNQTDLSPLKIFVLDAFFEMYVVVGSGAQSQYSSFRNALDFAQEYAILAASMEDRPFVPVSTIVLEGIPRDLKRVFRKWEDARSPTVTNTYSALRRGRSLRVVPLSQALQALND